MANIWIKCLGIVHAEKDGKLTTFRAGDWCKVGKGEARRLIAEGKAEIPKIGQQESAIILLQNAGVCLWGSQGEASRVEAKYPTLDINREERPTLTHPKTFLWDGLSKVRPNLLPMGFGYLEKWQVAAPVLNMVTLAQDLGEESERSRLEAVIHDLRVPVYDVGMIFVRRCKATKKLIDDWNQISGNRYLAFLEALYLNPLLILALPVNWRQDE